MTDHEALFGELRQLNDRLNSIEKTLSTIAVQEENDLLTLSLTETTYGVGSWSAIWWDHTMGDDKTPFGLTLKIKIDASITGSASNPDSAVYLWVKDDVNKKEVEFYFAYDFAWPGGSNIVDASGTTEEQTFNLADYGLANPDKLIIELTAYSYQTTTVTYEFDYIILE